jgi:hypothetical protein
MLRYLLISLFILFFSGIKAQTVVINSHQEEKRDQSGLSLGIDIAPFILVAFQPERRGAAFIGRYQFKERWFIVGEAGYANVNFDKDSYAYKSNGGFLKIGADYNFFKVNEPGNNDNITAGIRYGIATQTHQSPRYTIIDDYWGNYTGEFPTSNVTSHYIDFVGGLRTEVLKNFFMGWTVRLKVLMAAKTNNVLKPYTIPGYGKGDNTINVGFTYTLEYQIPFKKK